MPPERIIMRQGSRILPPKQGFALINALNTDYKVTAMAALYTGLRQVELWNLRENPHWYHASSRLIDLPAEGAAQKHQMTITDRTIRLTEEGCKAVETFLSVKPPVRGSSAYGKALRRAAVRVGIVPKGCNPKMFRKWLASYLVECRTELQIDSLDIAASLGHDITTLMKNYLGIGFSRDEHAAMMDMLRGWKS